MTAPAASATTPAGSYSPFQLSALECAPRLPPSALLPASPFHLPAFQLFSFSVSPPPAAGAAGANPKPPIGVKVDSQGPARTAGGAFERRPWAQFPQKS